MRSCAETRIAQNTESDMQAKPKRKNPWDTKQFKKSRIKGDPNSWRNAAKGITSSATFNQDADMALLDLTELPDLKALTKARNKALSLAHPDKGGTDEQARLILEAFERLKARLA